MDALKAVEFPRRYNREVGGFGLFDVIERLLAQQLFDFLSTGVQEKVLFEPLIGVVSMFAVVVVILRVSWLRLLSFSEVQRYIVGTSIQLFQDLYRNV